MSVRRAGVGDEAIVRKVRLEALADAPDDLDSTLERELAWTTSEWREWTSRGATFVLEQSGEPKGMVAGVPHDSDPAAVFLMAMWVDPALRGTGAADTLVASALAWAKVVGAAQVWLHVVMGNRRARRFYERNGFRATGREHVRERDGAVEIEMRWTRGELAV